MFSKPSQYLILLLGTSKLEVTVKQHSFLVTCNAFDLVRKISCTKCVTVCTKIYLLYNKWQLCYLS